jgi:anti-sigma factor RsiW
MTTISNDAQEREDIETLLPWHAAGTLSRRDAQRVEQAIANDPELAKRFALAREELAETIYVNETLGAPSARAMEKLFAAIDAEGGAARESRPAMGIGAWLASFVAGFSPRTLAYAGAAAAIAIMLQAAVIVGTLTSQYGAATYQTASHGEVTKAATGAHVIVRFNPQASAAEITRFLESHKAVVVDGPKADGIYRVRVADAALAKEDVARIVTQMQKDRTVGFVAAE